MLLQTDRLILRNYTMDNVPAVQEYFSDGEDGAEYSIDYDFNPKFRHKGYALEAAKEIVRYLTENPNIKEIYADCDERNTASAKLLERLGFELIRIADWAYKDDADGNPIMVKAAA